MSYQVTYQAELGLQPELISNTSLTLPAECAEKCCLSCLKKIPDLFGGGGGGRGATEGVGEHSV